MATQTVINETRLPKFQEDYMANLLTSAEGLFKPTDEGGLGLTMPFAEAQQQVLVLGKQQLSMPLCQVSVPISHFCSKRRQV